MVEERAIQRVKSEVERYALLQRGAQNGTFDIKCTPSPMPSGLI
jgi:hypothetical protein